MTSNKLKKNIKKLILLTVIVSLSACSSEQWYLVGRHGSCYDLTGFSKMEPLLSGSKTPSDIENKLKKAGVKYAVTKLPNGILQIDARSKDLGLILVQKKYCKEFVVNH